MRAEQRVKPITPAIFGASGAHPGFGTLLRGPPEGVGSKGRRHRVPEVDQQESTPRACGARRLGTGGGLGCLGAGSLPDADRGGGGAGLCRVRGEPRDHSAPGGGLCPDPSGGDDRGAAEPRVNRRHQGGRQGRHHRRPCLPALPCRGAWTGAHLRPVCALAGGHGRAPLRVGRHHLLGGSGPDLSGAKTQLARRAGDRRPDPRSRRQRDRGSRAIGPGVPGG